MLTPQETRLRFVERENRRLVEENEKLTKKVDDIKISLIELLAYLKTKVSYSNSVRIGEMIRELSE